jgi:hypothetical protein
MPVGAAIGAGSIGAALIGSSASQEASSQQVAAQQAALQQQQGFFNTAQSALSPYISGGQQYGSVLSSLLTPGPNQTAALSQIPGYQFAQDWGQKAVQNLGTTTGLGGNTLAAGANYATGLAQQNFGNLINPLISLYGTGAQAAGALAGSAGQFSGQATNTLTGIGQAQAAGTLGSANALAGGVNGIGNATLLSSLLNRGNTGIYGNPNSPLGSSSNYGGGNIFSGDAYGGSAANPLQGLTSEDYG